jgi:prepilin-type N-terminal cleavage/methylation domain-containing protein
MKSNKRGVTLIELVVVFAIIAIGAALVIPNVGAWLPNYRLRTATRDIVSIMRVAQMRAVSNNLSYRVSFDTGARTYILQYDSTGGGSWTDDGKAATLPNGTRMDPAPTNNPITFSPNSSSSGGTVTVKNTKNSERRITVLPSTGRITITIP